MMKEGMIKIKGQRRKDYLVAVEQSFRLFVALIWRGLPRLLSSTSYRCAWTLALSLKACLGLGLALALAWAPSSRPSWAWPWLAPCLACAFAFSVCGLIHCIDLRNVAVGQYYVVCSRRLFNHRCMSKHVAI